MISARATLFVVSLALALAYGIVSNTWPHAVHAAALAALKASGILVLAWLAWRDGATRLAVVALLFGAAGDALLALGEPAFLAGASAFLIGHLFYIAAFLRLGEGLRVIAQPRRTTPALLLIAAANVSTFLLMPQSSSLFLPLGVYTGFLTLMAIISLTLPAARWRATVGAILFFVSDGFVAANLFHPQTDPAAAFALNFAGWMIYWAGQTLLCAGLLNNARRTAPESP